MIRKRLETQLSMAERVIDRLLIPDLGAGTLQSVSVSVAANIIRSSRPASHSSHRKKRPTTSIDLSEDCIRREAATFVTSADLEQFSPTLTPADLLPISQLLREDSSKYRYKIKAIDLTSLVVPCGLELTAESQLLALAAQLKLQRMWIKEERFRANFLKRLQECLNLNISRSEASHLRSRTSAGPEGLHDEALGLILLSETQRRLGVMEMELLMRAEIVVDC